ncbi:hypothetical protein, partial [Pseudomonas putida]|uniref:hypothetical protein n=1 Tax=Pseudomonas putida TaxID=303 RepID=UPI001CB94938
IGEISAGKNAVIPSANAQAKTATKGFLIFVRLRRREWIAKVRVGPDTDTKVLAFRQAAWETPITFSRARSKQNLDRASPFFGR